MHSLNRKNRVLVVGAIGSFYGAALASQGAGMSDVHRSEFDVVAAGTSCRPDGYSTRRA